MGKNWSLIDLTGRRFGRLVVIGRAANSPAGAVRWYCQCDCGKTTTTHGDSLRRGASVACGCFKLDQSTRHGMSRTPTHISWSSMIQRIDDSNHPQWKRWGGRGIKVCERWRLFENFLSDMGEKPEGKSLDRINNEGDYEPGNCRWADVKTQQRNRRDSRLITYNGETHCMTEWAARIGISPTSLWRRLKSWPLEKAMTPGRLDSRA